MISNWELGKVSKFLWANESTNIGRIIKAEPVRIHIGIFKSCVILVN